MPYYEYECPKCKAVTEVSMKIQNADDFPPEEVPCGACGTISKRLPPTGVAVNWKGGAPTKRFH